MSEQLVTPVLRALSLLEWLVAGGAVDNLSEAARETGINRATLARLLATFEAGGVLTRGADGRVEFGTRMVRIAAGVLGDSDLISAAQSVLPRLAGELGLTAHLVTLDGGEVVFLQQHLPQTALVSRIGVGSRVAALDVAPGRVLLGLAPADGIEWSRSGLETGVGAAATGVARGPGGTDLVAAISVAGPQWAVDEVADRVPEALRTAAEAIGARLR
ncbi:IclR family transcriptional regulator [Granulicoccus phenolivorans]|uniref:IclR family transcriptional regulator n=1 Tax=Granulicoccus phenolivorans TaxID=266854 RepID=UPI0003FC2F81|nr:helix-turn-helix domain-containing protein [Granulicoccus phenolivorans]